MGYSRKNTPPPPDRWQTGNSRGRGGLMAREIWAGEGDLNLKILPWGSFLTLTLIDIL